MKKLIIGFILLWSMSSCDSENFFTPIVEIDLPAHKSKIVVMADWAPLQDSLRVFVTQSKSFLDTTSLKQELDTIAGVEVRVYRNDVLWATLTSSQNGFYTAAKQILANDFSTYRLEVKSPKHTTVTATQTLPKAVPIEQFTFKKNAITEFGSKRDLYTLSFNDPADAENYYKGFAEYINPAFNFLSQLQAMGNSDGTGNLLTDKAFNGKSYQWFATADFWNPQMIAGDTIRVQLISISKERFLYDKSYTLFENARNNPFSEPVLLYSNITNGYGYFSIQAHPSEKFIVF
jgi:hypothetical protein